MVLTVARAGGATYAELRIGPHDNIDCDALARRYLTAAERTRYEARHVRARTPFLLGRIAAKRAVLACLLATGSAGLEATEVAVANDERGCPRVLITARCSGNHDVVVSLAHKPAIAVALAAPGSRGVSLGVDVEQVEERSAAFEQAALTTWERALPVLEPRSRWLTRLWAVKEATAKATGRGLQGRPKDFEIEAAHFPRLRCNGRWVSTHSVGVSGCEFIVARTEGAEQA